MKIFGDDGFRDKLNSGLLHPSFLNKIFKSIDIVLKKKNINKIVIGYDTRPSYITILNIILKNLRSIKNIEILNHPISTPGLQVVSNNKNVFGIMITASHFSSIYNGFKFFLSGKKIDKNFENLIQKNIEKKNQNIPARRNIKRINGSVYYKKINKSLNVKTKEKVLVDCSNGSIASFYKKINFLKKTNVIHKNYKNNKINSNCGSNHLKKNIKTNLYKSFQYCIAYDGDADRVVIAKKNYGVIEAEKLALIFVNYLKKKKEINSIVATEISNPWLRDMLMINKIKLYYSKVGDRNVIKKKLNTNSTFGYENSGHFCFKDSMDGLYASGLFLKILSTNKNIISETLKKNITYKKKIYALKNNNLISLKKFLKKIKKDSTKIIIRKSIWNNYYKVYLFYKKGDLNLKKIQKFLKNKVLKIKIEN